MPEHSIRLHTRKTFYLNLSVFTCTLLRFITSHGIFTYIHLIINMQVGCGTLRHNTNIEHSSEVSHVEYSHFFG